METDWAGRNEKRIWICLIVLVLFRCWLFGLAVPFQLDETAPVWVIAGGWGDLLRRSTDFTQSILHCAILLLFQKAFGLHEWSMRLPSLIASSCSLILLYKLARRWFDPTGALLVLTLWLYVPGNPRLAMMARPYSFAMAAVFLGCLLLYRWLERPDAPRFIVYAVAVVLPFYFSFMYALVIPAHAIYLIYRLRTDLKLPRNQVVLLPLIWFALLLPLVPQMIEIGKSAALHTLPAPTQKQDWLFVLIPTSVAIAHLACWVTTRFTKSLNNSSGQREQGTLSREGLVLCLAIMACCTAPLYVVTKFFRTNLWTPMYMAGMSGAFALLHTAILRSLGPSRSRIAGFAAMSLLVLPDTLSMRTWQYEVSPVNYRAISQVLEREAAAPSTAVVMTSEFTEGFQARFPVDDYEKGELLAPLSMYPVRAEIRIVPYTTDQARPEYFAGLNNELSSYRRVVFFSSSPSEWFGKDFGTRYQIKNVDMGRRNIVIYERGD